MMNRRMALALLTFLALGGPARADIIYGKVVDIIDGDEFTVETKEGSEVNVKLAEINAPSRDQPYGREASEALASLVEGRVVRVVPLRMDTETVRARVYADAVNVNYEMVRNGYARADYGKVGDYMLYSLESEARAAKRGFWGTSESN